MLYSSPFQLYAASNNIASLKTIQLQWQSRGEEVESTAVFVAAKDEAISGISTLLQWLKDPIPFDVIAMRQLVNAKEKDGTSTFSESFLNFLQRFRFVGELWTISDGTFLSAGQPILQLQNTPTTLSIIQLWIQYLVKPESYLQTAENFLQIRRYYNSQGQGIQDTIYSLDKPPIVNFEARSWEDLLQPVTIVNQ